jgi:hypothetical protein
MKSTIRISMFSLIFGLSAAAHADVATDWNARAAAMVAAEKLPGAYAYRAMAIAQVASQDAVQAALGSGEGRWTQVANSQACAPEAALAAANRVVLEALLPAHRTEVDAAYRVALSALPDAAPTRACAALGERIGAALLERAAGDGFSSTPAFRADVVPGAWQPTALPLAAQWPNRQPWLIGRADRFRPGPPPALTSKRWATDFAEIKAVGARDSSVRTPEQATIARFWEATTPGMYFDVVRSVAEQPGRDLASNARLLALAATAMDDALIAVFDAKYHYGFWRPITAIRNADRDGNADTAADPAWIPFIETPMHPEYPCAHCILASTIGSVLAAELGSMPVPRLHATSPTLPGVERQWQSIDVFVAEVANARIYDGVHFRNSTEVGTKMGTIIGATAAADAHFARTPAQSAGGTITHRDYRRRR